MTCESTEAKFPATVEMVQEVVSHVTAAAEHCGLDASRLPHIELAVEEAAVNVSHYAYGGSTGELVVRTSCQDDELRIELEDSGAPFDPLAAPPPDLEAPLEERRIGGLGIFLVRKVCDEVLYRREGDRNILTLVLRRRR